jgi:RimJ/RimL family protein N-acetyltransferase
MEHVDIQIRPFKPEEWDAYKTIRLKALDTDPRSFGESLSEAKAKPDDHYKERVSNPNGALFGIFHNADLIGVTGIVVDKDDPSGATAKLWGSWLEPSWRGKGLSRKMYEARINWAKAQPGVKRVIVSHRKSNNISKKANQRWGFKFTHAAERVWPGNQKETEFFYELVVKP